VIKDFIMGTATAGREGKEVLRCGCSCNGKSDIERASLYANCGENASEGNGCSCGCIGEGTYSSSADNVD
jgi:hypothetical protein